MELAWFLTGLTYASRAEKNDGSISSRWPRQTYRLLQSNQGKARPLRTHGQVEVVGGSGARPCRQFCRSGVSQFLRWRILAKFFGVTEASQNALRCARDDLQTARSFRPMVVALRFGDRSAWLGATPCIRCISTVWRRWRFLRRKRPATSTSASPSTKGLSGSAEQTNYKQDLENAAAGVVWRCIRPTNLASYAARIRTLMGEEQDLGTAEILFECRPYELGWLLDAHARATSTPVRAYIDNCGSNMAVYKIDPDRG